MKKIIIGFVAMLMLVISTVSFANVQKCDDVNHQHDVSTTQITLYGAHCRGTLGCGCPGFAPITNGDVWQQAYCRHCGHARGYHR